MPSPTLWLAPLVLLSAFATASPHTISPSKQHFNRIHPDTATTQPQPVIPQTLYATTGHITNATSLLSNTNPGSALFLGPSTATYDFGRAITGRVALRIGDVDAEQYVGLAYSQTPPPRLDALSRSVVSTREQWIHPTGPGNFSVEDEEGVRGWRFLSLVHNSTGGVEVQRIVVYGT